MIPPILAYIEIVQLNSNAYFWSLVFNGKFVARSTSIDSKEIIIKEAEEIAKMFDIGVYISERK